MKPKIYTEKYVAFIDMLGFSELVSDSVNNEVAYAAVVDAIDRLRATACEIPSIDLVQTYFSDCIVLSSARTPDGLAGMLDAIRVVAENLVVVDVFVRGGLAAGPIFHDAQFMFGPGMLSAYHLESKVAINPAVVVTTEVEQEIVGVGLGHMLFHDSESPERKYVHHLIR